MLKNQEGIYTATMAAIQKHTLHERPALIALGERVRLLPEHTRVYRKRHVLPLLMAGALMVGFVAQVVVIVAENARPIDTAFSSPGVSSDEARLRGVISSSYGFALAYKTDAFAVTTMIDGQTQVLSTSELHQQRPLSSILLTPLPGRVAPAEATTQLEIRSESDAAAFAAYKADLDSGKDIMTITADYFAPAPSDLATVTRSGQGQESIGGVAAVKTTYLIQPSFSDKKTTTIVWSGQIQGRPFAVVIRGIQGETQVTPAAFTEILQSLSLQADQQVQGLTSIFNDEKPVIEQKYVADLVSPSVVKIYHVVCGSLVYKGQALTDDLCTGMTGSGFFVSNDGYIATNGHVVVYGAHDMFTRALLANPRYLKLFLQDMDLSEAQIDEVMGRQDLTAAAIAKIYDMPTSEIRLANERKRTIVSLGSKPLELSSDTAVKQAMGSFRDSDDMKQATVVAYDYIPKDQYRVVSDSTQGFQGSDVALLKIDVADVPALPISTALVTQNQPVHLFGFPGDAENSLVDTSSLGVSVTNGSISAIREAAGGKTKLYQTDADASRGNSGGPAVDDEGHVIGLLTYRFSTGSTTDAAKSYIRDIQDVTKLINAQNIVLQTSSQSQKSWERGLTLYAKQHYKPALQEFNRVNTLYTPHRLVDVYITQTQQAITAGKDQTPPPLMLLVVGIGIGALVVVMLGRLVVRHYGHHRVYRAYHRHHIIPHHHA